MTESFRDTPSLRLLRALHRAHRHITDADSAELSRHGLQTSEFDVIATLGNNDGLRMCDVAARMLTSPANVTRIVKKLEARGLVTRCRSETNEREVFASLTEEGTAVFDQLYPAMYRFVRDWLDARLGPTEQAQLTELLEALQKTAPSR